MRLASYISEDGMVPAVVIGSRLVGAVAAFAETAAGAESDGAAPTRSMRDLIQMSDAELLELQGAAESIVDDEGIEIEEAKLGAPIPDANKVLCIGLNYLEHQREGAALGVEAAQALPDYPVVFNKFQTSLIGHDGVIVPPAATSQLDWEAELAVVMRRQARNVPLESALDHVAGYAPFNDVSARDLQLRSPQWAIGKGFDTSGPMGPVLVLADEVPDPQDLTLRARLNGDVVQEANTSQMLFGVAQLIEYISSAITLEPGDIIATGTPAGVGVARRPPLFMQPGDVIDVEIDGLGRLSNTVAAPDDPFMSQLEKKE